MCRWLGVCENFPLLTYVSNHSDLHFSTVLSPVFFSLLSPATIQWYSNTVTQMDLLKLRPNLQWFPTKLTSPSHKTQSFFQRLSVQSAIKQFRVRSELNGKLNGALSGDTDPRSVDRVFFFLSSFILFSVFSILVMQVSYYFPCFCLLLQWGLWFLHLPDEPFHLNTIM